MSDRRGLTSALLGLRVAYGAALILAPAQLTRRWLGDVAQRPGGAVSLRALGAREVALHTAALWAAWTRAPLRPWLAASIAGDLTDVIATTAARRGLPEGSAPATLAVGAGSALLTALLAAAVPR
jgi:hypothetical protein